MWLGTLSWCVEKSILSLLTLNKFPAREPGQAHPAPKKSLALAVDDKTVKKNCISSQNASFRDSIGYDKVEPNWIGSLTFRKVSSFLLCTSYNSTSNSEQTLSKQAIF